MSPPRDHGTRRNETACAPRFAPGHRGADARDRQPDADLRAELAGSQIIGLAVARYIIGVEPLASADVETIVAAVGPTIQRYLAGPLPEVVRGTSGPRIAPS